MIVRNIATTTHGRYLVNADAGAHAPLLIGLHGYAEDAQRELERLKSIPGGDGWIRVAVQGLHRFYRGRSSDVIASWMTAQDRELAIADNIAYVSRVVESVGEEWSAEPPLVFNGFSQGVAMAFRAAAHSPRLVSGVIACGGDIPPELDAKSLARIGGVLLGRGVKDEWYTHEKLDADERRLQSAGVGVQVIRFEGGHEWPAAFAEAAGRFLRGCRERELSNG